MNNASLQGQKAFSLSGTIAYAAGGELPLSGKDVLSFSGQMGVGDGWLLGAAVSQQCMLMLHNPEEVFTAGRTLFGARVQLFLQADDRSIPLAVFFVSGVSRQDGSAFLTLKGSDALGSAFDDAFSDEYSYPCTLRHMAEGAVQAKGFSLDGDFPMQDQLISRRPEWGDISYRGFLSCIAQACGCFCRVTGEGKIQFCPVWQADAAPFEIFPDHTFRLEGGDASFGPLTGLTIALQGAKKDAPPLTLQADETPLDGFNSLQDMKNPLFRADDADVQAFARRLFSEIKGLRFTRLAVQARGDAGVQLGSRIRVHDTRGGFLDSCVTSLGFSMDNGFIMQADCNFRRPSGGAGRLFTPTGGLNAAMLQGTSDASFLKAESITTQHLASRAVTAEKLDAASVTAEKIAAGEVTAQKLAAGAVTAEKIAADSIRTVHLTSGAVTADKIGAGAIDADHIRSKSITANQLAAGLITANSGLIGTGAIGTVQIADGSITDAKIVSLNADVIQSGTLKTDRLLLTGDGGLVYEINAASSGLSQRELDKEEYRQKMDGSVLVGKSVTAAQIAAETITANEILSGAITADKLQAHAVTTEKLAAHSVTANKLSSDVGSSLDLSSNRSVQLMVNRVETAVAQTSGQQMTISFDTAAAVEKERQSLTARVHVWKNGEDITEEIPVSAFTWQKESGQEEDAAWEETNAGKTAVTLTRADIGKSCIIRCTVDAAESYGKFQILNGELMWMGKEAFRLENGCLFGDGETYVLQDGTVYHKKAPGRMTVSTTAFDHSVLENSGLTITDEGVHLFTGGAFTVDSGNFSIDKNGNVTILGKVTAEDGEIGGWKISPGSLQSGEGEKHVRLSTEDETYALWAGAEQPSSDDAQPGAPFRVTRDGKVYLTKLLVLKEDGTESVVDLRSSYWQLGRTVKTLKQEGDNVTIELYSGESVNFRTASAVNFSGTPEVGGYHFALYGGNSIYRAVVPVTVQLDNGKERTFNIEVFHTLV